MADGRHIENRFRPQHSSRLSGFSEILREEAVFHRIWDRYPRSTECISCFPNAVWASASREGGASRIVSDALVIFILMS